MKLQQKIALSLCAFYLISVIGIAMNMHYCSGKLSSVRFTETAKCAACKSEKTVKGTHDCCKTTEIDAKVKDSHEPGSKIRLPFNFSIELFIAPFVFELFKDLLPNLFSKAENKAPPLSSIISLHVYNCVFRN
ncbi:HYC_CC_PP family protein [Pedobacter metabolipauper]|uniref:Uncharacterized protein n=1 Tax=Pedobacter metabolipauper TaxID=425513 RepID=A0A4R6SY41_9SPHI|nr:hypothetical protein [Pedobacter metabolipauper]TDQ09594.1 hypothetical protein ATK78_1750 [Pedobacter metabolipauper]